jgi:hypothetical protein
LIGAMGSIVGVPIILTTDHVIIAASSTMSVTAPVFCTAGRGGEWTFAPQRDVRC